MIFLLGHRLVETTERCLGSRQQLVHALNDGLRSTLSVARPERSFLKADFSGATEDHFRFAVTRGPSSVVCPRQPTYDSVKALAFGDYLEIATRTAMTIRLEGGNDLVSQPLIRARLGMLDLQWFKRQIEYCRCLQ
jgi:hypothetical protein